MRTILVLAALIGCGGEPSPDAGGLPEAETCDVPPPDDATGRIAAEGTRLVDANGRLVFLRGMNTGGRSKFPPFVPFDFADDSDFDRALGEYWDRMAAWGFTVARLVFTWEAVEPTEGTYDEVFLSRYERMIDAAWARGIRVLVDFHQDVYARMYCGDGFPEWTIPAELVQTPPEDCSAWFSGYLSNDGVRGSFDRFWTNADGIQDAYQAMFDEMVARFADRPGVIGFEAMNEPGWGSGSMAAWERDVWTPFFAAFAEHVHEAAPETLVFLDAPGLDGLTSSTAIEDPSVPGIVFAPHYYDPNAVVTGEYVSDGAAGDAVQTWVDVGAEWDVPVLLGEFGVDKSIAGVREYMRDVMAALDVHGLSGTAWEYSTAGELWSAENFGVVESDGTERPEHLDGLVRPFVRAVAGTDLVAAYDEETRTFTASFTADADGVTELSIPDRVYPDGVRVAMRGGCAQVDADHHVVRIRTTGGEVTLELTPAE